MDGNLHYITAYIEKRMFVAISYDNKVYRITHVLSLIIWYSDIDASQGNNIYATNNVARNTRQFDPTADWRKPVASLKFSDCLAFKCKLSCQWPIDLRQCYGALGMQVSVVCLATSM